MCTQEIDRNTKETLACIDSEIKYDRALVREALAKYIFPLIKIDAKHPSSNLFDAEYEHKKEVFGHKLAKDFIIKQNKLQFSEDEMKQWFEVECQSGNEQTKNQIPLLNYLNSIISNQIDYILDTIEEHGLDFYNARDYIPELAK